MKWLVAALLWGVALLNYLDRQVIFSLFPLLERDLHATNWELGLISTVFLTVYGVCSLFAGYVADRAGRVRVILVSLAVWTLATWITGQVHSIGQMLGARALMGLSEAFYLPAGLALIADWHDSKSRSLATGLHQSGLYTGIVLGGAWGGWMGDHSGWRPVFSILGILGAAYLLILLVTLREKTGDRSALSLTGSLSRVWRSPGFVGLLLAFISIAIANWLIYTWLPLFLYERFHMNMTRAGFSATFYIQAASYAAVLAGGILSDRWAAKDRRARVKCQMAGLAVAAPFLLLLGSTDQMPLLIAALIAFGAGRGLVDCNTMPVVRDLTPAHLSATAYGVLNAAGCLAGGVVAGAAGLLKQNLGLGAAFQLAALVLLAGALALTQSLRTLGSPAVEPASQTP